MPNENGKLGFDQLDAYLDGQLGLTERKAFELELRRKPALRREVELQQRIDGSLRRLLPAPTPTREVAPMLAKVETTPENSGAAVSPNARASRTRRWAGLLAAAAAAAWMLAGWQQFRNVNPVTVFTPEPLVQIYQQTVANGFEPYYECRDDERFRQTFFDRQAVALTLSTLPEGSAMMGLSYPGGLSRNTTAMLCRVDGQPVMVFVDRASADQPDAGANDQPELNVFREERDGLVFYEITPYEAPRMTKYLQPASNKAAGDATTSRGALLERPHAVSPTE